MQLLRWWTRPALFALLWIVLAASTAAELATVGPALRTASSAPVSAMRSVSMHRARDWHARRLEAP